MSHAAAPDDAYEHHGHRVAREAFYEIACDPRRSVAVEACAGAGKTWMLVSRIVRALLDGAQPHEILAITFTKKAAGEMRERLNKWLEEFSRLDDEGLRAQLAMRGLRVEAGSPLLARLRGLYRELLSAGRPVQIRTFHSWFAALLRTAPLATLEALGLPARHELLENDAEAVALVWRRFFTRVSADPALRADYEACVAVFGRTQTEKSLHAALSKRVEFALADAQGVVDASVQPWAQVFPDLAGVADPMDHLLIEGPTRALMWEAAGLLGRASQASFAKCGVALESALTAGDVKGVVAALLTQKGAPRKFSEKVAGIERVCEAQAHLLHLREALAQHKAWQHQGRMARLTRLLIDEFGALKRDEGWVDMNDVERAALVLLSDPVLSGWVQERLDARTAHLLIDEFQDTNPLQWQALYGWLSAYAGAGPGEAPCVFLVGDPKQSIYRFRRAEPQVFKAAQAFVVQGLAGALLSCDHTRRCAPAVVDTLNSAMLAAVQAGEYSSDFRQHTTESHEPGEVVALPQVPRNARERDGAVADAAWRDSLVTPRVLLEDTMSALEARQAADWIAGEVHSGRLSPDGLMVLARRRERLAWMFEALRERGIASEQPEKLDLCESPAVQDVVALLDALVSTRHDLSLARALKSPLFGWGDDALAWMARLQQHWTVRPGADAQPVKPSWWTVLQRFADLPEQELVGLPSVPQPLAQAFSNAATRLLRYRQWVQSLPPHDALSAIYGDGDVLARFAQAVPASQRAGVLAQLRDLLANALAQDGGRFLTSYRFVRALKAGGIKATPTHNSGAVRLLTIHGAKGLEAHTVLMLDTDTGSSRPESMGVLIDWPGEAPVPRRFVFLASEKNPPACAASALALEQQARSLEELNALYVALTRAESRLVISSFEPYSRPTGTTSWYERLLPLTQPLEKPPQTTMRAPADTAGADTFSLLALPTLIDVASTAPPEPVEPLAADDERTRIGLALHRLLQWHPTPARGFDWTNAHTQAVAREFALNPAQAAQAQTMARRIVQGEAAWAWDDGVVDTSGNEVDIFHAGELLRLDRLVRRSDTGEWWVLDFKSAENPEQQQDLLTKMQRYRQAVRAARSGAKVRLAFINLHGRLIELQDTTINP